MEPHKVETQRDKGWKDLTSEEKQIESRVMEVYAAMVETMDKNIGRILDKIKELDEEENTFILFMSDNGAEGMMMEALATTAERFQYFVSKYYKNNLENIGKKDSFVWYSDQWAQAATAPYYMYKMWASEGGIRCPLIISHPNLIKKENNGHVKTAFVTVMDILPTILDLAQIEHPFPLFKGRNVVKVRGSSWVKYLKDQSEYVHDENKITGWELFAQQAIRKGQYKALFIPKPLGPDKWQLFDLSKDPGETDDLSLVYPALLNELINYWSEYVAETGLVECSDIFYEALKAEYEPKILY